MHHKKQTNNGKKKVLEKWLYEWLTVCVKPTVKKRTYELYAATVGKIIVPSLGQYGLNELDTAVLQSFTAELSERYSANTVSGVISVLKRALKRAVDTGVVDCEYSGTIKKPKIREKREECFSVAEQKKIERYIIGSGKPRLYGILFCFYTGLRIGELLAVEWSDVNFAKGTLSVTKTCRDKWQGGVFIKEVDTPKTEASERVIPLPRQIMPYLSVLKVCGGGKYVFTNNGNTLTVRSYQKTFERMLKNLDIPHKGFHAIRHTFATRALECGMDVKTLSEILGHKNPSVTLKRYAHSMFEHKSAMMNKVGELLC